MSIFDRFSRFLRVIRIARTATDAQLQSIGDQAFRRVEVAALIANGGTDPSYVDNGNIAFRSGPQGFPVQFGCGFLNESDAKAFLARLSSSLPLKSAVPYSQSTDHYRLDGWVGSVWPPRCNAKYFDWGSGGKPWVVLDLGPVQAIEFQQVE
jgi:hypothetical protein